MNETDILRRAKYYMDCMAAGENPITNEPFGDDAEIRNENFIKCFKYISCVLEGEIERRGEERGSGRYSYKSNRSEFFLSEELREKVQISPDSVGINTVAARINDVIDQSSMKGVSGGKLAECLVRMGYLTVIEMPGGGRVRSATEKGAAAGIETIDKTDSVGKAYRQNVYSTEMQRFLINNINDIIRHAKEEFRAEPFDGVRGGEKDSVEDSFSEAEMYEDEDGADYDLYGI